MQLYMVGDSPDSDIKGGKENGFKTLLVKTGNYKHNETKLNEWNTPDYIVEDVYEAVDKILKL